MSPVLVRRGMGIGFVSYYMHRRKDLFGPDAMDFRPERWEGPELANIRSAYIPFHGGPQLFLGSKSFLLSQPLKYISNIVYQRILPWRKHLVLSSASSRDSLGSDCRQSSQSMLRDTRSKSLPSF